MKYKGVIFDLDGVICHTDQYHYLAWKQIADGLHIPFDECVNNRLRGVSRMESLDIILERHPEPLELWQKEELAAEKNSVYQRLLMHMTPDDLSDEVKSTLDTLRRNHLKLAIGSSSKNAKRILERLGLTGYSTLYQTAIQSSNPSHTPKCSCWRRNT